MPENALAVLERLEDNQDVDTIRGKLIVTLEGADFQKDLAFFGLDIHSTQPQIIAAVWEAINESHGVDIRNTYKVRKSLENQNVFIIPDSTAG